MFNFESLKCFFRDPLGTQTLIDDFKQLEVKLYDLAIKKAKERNGCVITLDVANLTKKEARVIIDAMRAGRLKINGIKP